MPCDKFDPDCDDCRPKLLDWDSGALMPPDCLEARVLLKVWSAAPAAQKEGFWRCAAKGSKDPADAEHARALWTKVAEETETAYEERDRARTAN